jgi:hypothetical protein
MPFQLATVFPAMAVSDVPCKRPCVVATMSEAAGNAMSALRVSTAAV